MGQDRVNAEARAHADSSGPKDWRLWLHRGSVPYVTDSPSISLTDWATLQAAAAQSDSALDSAIAGLGGEVATWWTAAKAASYGDSVADRVAAVRQAILMA
jgi:hypothetical protein